MIIKKAGCILLKLETKHIGLVYRIKQNDYSFPKGHLEQGESLEKCAIRETEEETGRIAEIISSVELPTLKYVSSNGEEVINYFYLAKDNGPSKCIFAEDLVHDLVWVKFEDIECTLSYNNLKQYWGKIKGIIEEKLASE